MYFSSLVIFLWQFIDCNEAKFGSYSKAIVALSCTWLYSMVVASHYFMTDGIKWKFASTWKCSSEHYCKLNNKRNLSCLHKFVRVLCNAWAFCYDIWCVCVCVCGADKCSIQIDLEKCVVEKRKIGNHTNFGSSWIYKLPDIRGSYKVHICI